MQNQWINDTLAEWDQDATIIWRVFVTHFPMWTLNVPQENMAGLNQYLLPILREKSFDLYLAGHEHLTSFSYIKSETPL